MSDGSECEFCVEFELPEASLFCNLFSEYGVKSRVIHESKSYVAIAGLGALTEGYVLLLPKKHYLSLSHLSSDEIAEFDDFKRDSLSLVNEFYHNLICFEHGAASNNRKGGSCLDHAHLHVCPCPTDLSLQIDERFQSIPIDSIMGIHSFAKDKPYLYYENQKSQKFVYILPDKIESQYVRRLWATSLGLPDQWDWAISIGTQNILNTLKNLVNIK